MTLSHSLEPHETIVREQCVDTGVYKKFGFINDAMLQ